MTTTPILPRSPTVFPRIEAPRLDAELREICDDLLRRIVHLRDSL